MSDFVDRRRVRVAGVVPDGEGAFVEEDAGVTPPDGHELPLAVCGKERAVLGLKGCDLLLGGVALVLAEHRLP